MAVPHKTGTVNSTDPNEAFETLALRDLVPVSDLVQRLHRTSSGTTLSPKILGRWHNHGLHGVRLKCVRAGRRLLSTEKWLLEFFEAVAAARAPKPAPPKPVAVSAKRRSSGQRKLATAQRLAATGMLTRGL